MDCRDALMQSLYKVTSIKCVGEEGEKKGDRGEDLSKRGERKRGFEACKVWLES